jgi:hypothetical protein
MIFAVHFGDETATYTYLVFCVFLRIFGTSLFLRLGIVSLTLSPRAGGPPIVGCPWLLIQYIRSFPPYLEGVSSIRNLRTRNAVVTRVPPNISYKGTAFIIIIIIIIITEQSEVYFLW